jgi:hypothetical protein
MNGSSRAAPWLAVLAAWLAPVVAAANEAPREAVPWGKPAKVVKTGAEVPVRARLQIEGDLGEAAPVVAAGKPIVLRLEVQNAGSKDVLLRHAGFWPNHRLIVRDASGAEPARLAKGKAAAAAFSPRGPRDKNVDWPLAPGKIDASEGAYDLGELFDLSKGGAYSVQVEYEEDIAFATNRLAFTIEAAERGAESVFEFTGKVVSVEVAGKRRLPALVTHFDPRFLVTVHVLSVSDPNAPFRTGDYPAFAIHSPAQTFGAADPMGRTFTFQLTSIKEKNQTPWRLARAVER